MADVQGMGAWSGVRPLGFPGDGGCGFCFCCFLPWLFGRGGDMASGECRAGAVWGDIACGAGCGPLKLQGWSK